MQVGYIPKSCENTPLVFAFNFAKAKKLAGNAKNVIASIVKDDGETLEVPLVLDGKKVYCGTYFLASDRHKPNIIVDGAAQECYIVMPLNADNVEKYWQTSEYFVNHGER